MERSCGTCTKCCDGWLTATIRGHKMGMGTSCFFVKSGVGCSDYENRPEDPCKRYECAWLSHLDMPDLMKPNISDCIIDIRTYSPYTIFHLTEAGSNFNIESIEILKKYSKNKNMNCSWYVNNKYGWHGDSDFNLFMSDRLKTIGWV